jgi:flagellar basal-body rod modification protein FlgD
MATTVNNTTNTTSSINDLMSTMNSKATTATDSVSADTDKFMTLLVTQLKNQDPLNPLDNAQVTSQLAQLQTVTGVNKLNTTLESLKSSYQSSESMQATNLIGHGVLVEGNNVTLSSSQGIIGVELGSDATSRAGEHYRQDRQGRADHGPGRAEGRHRAAGLGRRARCKNNVGSDGKPVTLADGDYSVSVVAQEQRRRQRSRMPSRCPSTACSASPPIPPMASSSTCPSRVRFRWPTSSKSSD